MIIREEINFIRTKDSKKSLEVGLENNPWILHDYLITIFNEKGYYTRESGQNFEENNYYSVIFNIGISSKEFIEEGNGLVFLRFKLGRNKFKYAVDQFHTPEGEDPLFRSNDWGECVNYIDQNIEKWS